MKNERTNATRTIARKGTNDVSFFIRELIHFLALYILQNHFP